MIVKALLPADALRRLRRALPDEFQIGDASVPEVMASLGATDGGAVVLDPCLLRADVFESLLTKLSLGASPILLYTSLSLLSAQRVLAVEQRLHAELVFAGAKEEDAILRRCVEALAQPTVLALVFRGIVGRLHRLQKQFLIPVVGLFGWLRIVRRSVGPEQVHALSGDSARLALRHAGLTTPSGLMKIAAVARSFEILNQQGSGLVHGYDDTIARVARSCGYPAVRTLERQFDRFVGVSPHEATQLLSAVEVSARLVAALRDFRQGDEESAEG